MCLITEQRVAKFTTEDIPVYKMVKVYSEEIRSPWYDNFKWKVGKIHRIFYWPWNILRLLKERGSSVSYINRSFHAYLRPDLCRPEYTLYDAIIPKGSWYFISDDGNEIASNRLKLIKPHVQL